MVSVGSRNALVTILAPTDSQAASGEVTTSYAAFGTRWVRFEDLSGRESMIGQAAQSEATIRITMPWDQTLDAVTTRYRITFGSRTLEINSIANVSMRNRELVMMCTELQ